MEWVAISFSRGSSPPWDQTQVFRIPGRHLNLWATREALMVRLLLLLLLLLQSCPTLCDPIDSSPPGSPVPGVLQARTLEWVAISFSNASKWKLKVESVSRVQLLATPWTAAYQAPPSMGFSRHTNHLFLRGQHSVRDAGGWIPQTRLVYTPPAPPWFMYKPLISIAPPSLHQFTSWPRLTLRPPSPAHRFLSYCSYFHEFNSHFLEFTGW